MSGYNAAFPSLITGTLFGRWPDIGLWAVLISIKDSAGTIDVTHEYLSVVTGLALEEVRSCMRRFCQPDPGSRSREADGARLSLLDSHRDWGWRVVNHSLYQERTRTQNRIADGRNADAVRRYKERKKDKALSNGHRKTPEDTSQSQSQSQSQSHTGLNPGTHNPPVDFPDGLDRQAWADWVAYRRSRRLSVSSQAVKIHQRILLPYPPEIQRQMVEQSIQSGWQGLFALKGNGVPRVAKPDLLADWHPPED